MFRTIDLEGTATLPVELGVTVEVYVSGAQEAQTTSEDCVIWDIMDSGGGGGSGTASVSGTPVTLDCDQNGCSLPTTSLNFLDVPVDPGDPLNIVVVAPETALGYPFLRQGWAVTETIRLRAVFFFGLDYVEWDEIDWLTHWEEPLELDDPRGERPGS